MTSIGTEWVRLTSLVLCTLVATLLVGCNNDMPMIPGNRDAIRILAVGDWGRDGQSHQADLANAMEAISSRKQPHIILSLGDNFYPDGVDSVNDSQWRTSFENIYAGVHLQVPWYVALGNHDYYGDPTSEIRYSNTSKRWRMPSYYYTQLLKMIDGTKLRLVVLDTSPFDKSLYGDPAFTAKIGKDTTTQKVWMDSVFSLNDANWTLVAGHHPVYTGGARANQYNSVANSLLPIFSRHNIPVYFAGHEHDLQHLKASNHPTHQFISGAGSELRATGVIPITKFSASIQGVMSIEVTKSTMEIFVISYQLDTLYQVKILK